MAGKDRVGGRGMRPREIERGTPSFLLLGLYYHIFGYTPPQKSAFQKDQLLKSLNDVFVPKRLSQKRTTKKKANKAFFQI